jgi:hypothetical protein
LDFDPVVDGGIANYFILKSCGALRPVISRSGSDHGCEAHNDDGSHYFKLAGSFLVSFHYLQ